MKILLMDNGSLEPAATLALRQLAQRLSAQTGREIVPVSILHSHKVASAQLEGVAAETVEIFLRTHAAKGEMEFGVLPLFIGPSRAITEYLPGVIVKLQQEFPRLRVRIAPTLWQKDDARLARMLAERVREKLSEGFAHGEAVRVALVDHGSPVPAVTAVRDAVAVEVAKELGGQINAVVACSMERRPGPDYDFNEPLLATLLKRDGWSTSAVIVAQLFLMPGRHAGAEGDLATICAQAEAEFPTLCTVRTEVLSTHPLLLEILRERLNWLDKRD